MPRLSEAFGRDSAYWGARGDWFLAYATNRDADTLRKSNWRSFIRALGGKGTEGAKGTQEINERLAIEEASHWACGWVQYLIIHPEAADLIAKAEEVRAALEDYPVLNEQDWSELEDAERQKAWDDFARREWFKWFAAQCETEEDAEWFTAEHGEALESFLCRAYEARCMGCGEAGSGPCRDETLESAWRASECAWWRHDEKITALAEALELKMEAGR